MSCTTRLLSALPLLAVLSACIAIPVGLGGEEPFKGEDLAFIEIGKSTKEDIAAAMPQPMQFLDGKMWLYVRTRKEANWAIGYITLDGDIDGTTTGGVELRYLAIRFDDSGVVAGYETSSWGGGAGCNRSGVCYLLGATYMLVAPEEENRVVKQFDQAADRCAIYVYGRQSNLVHITLDNRQIGGIFGKKRFIFEQINPGPHRLKATHVHGPIEFVCAAGSSVFFEINRKPCKFFSDCGHNQIEVAQRDVSKGRQAIAKRGWIVTISD